MLSSVPEPPLSRNGAACRCVRLSVCRAIQRIIIISSDYNRYFFWSIFQSLKNFENKKSTPRAREKKPSENIVFFILLGHWSHHRLFIRAEDFVSNYLKYHFRCSDSRPGEWLEHLVWYVVQLIVPNRTNVSYRIIRILTFWFKSVT